LSAVQESTERLAVYRRHLTDALAMLELALETRQSTEALEFVVGKLRSLIADAERELRVAPA